MKPHAGNPGFVCELKCRLGGHVVVYDRKAGASIEAETRWIVMHEPSSLHVAVKTESQARAVMKGVAKAATIEEACSFADILPQPGRDEDLAPASTPAAAASSSKRGAEDDARRDAALARFLADPENEPSAEGKAALKRAFDLTPTPAPLCRNCLAKHWPYQACIMPADAGEAQAT